MKTRRAVARIWAAVARTSTFLAAFLEAVARVADATSTRLRSGALRARSLSTGVPIGAELAGAGWAEPAALPVAAAPAAVQPPPIPAEARANHAPVATPADDESLWRERITRAKSEVEDWNTALAAAKRDVRPATSSSGDEWGAAIVAAKRRAALPRPRPRPSAAAPGAAPGRRAPTSTT
jgi:hypothetical protein